MAYKGVIVFQVSPVVLIQPQCCPLVFGVHIALYGGAAKVVERFIRLTQRHPLKEIAYKHLEGISVPISIVAGRPNLQERISILGHAAPRFEASDGATVTSR